MAEGQWGGKRTPRNPAPVSAPGALSRRTDGGPQQVQPRMSGMPYGENQDFEEMQSAAPMSASPSSGRANASARKAPAMSGGGVSPLFSPTQRPDEPITAGAPFGPGEGPAGNAYATDYDDDIAQIKQYMPDLETAMKFPNAPKTFIALVNYLKNM